MSKEEEDKVGIRARSILWYLTFIGFAMNYMIRININIAIVDMISPEFKSKAVTSSECFELENSTSVARMQNGTMIYDGKSYVSLEKRLLDYFNVSTRIIN
jgi:hypothetical protein